LKRSERLEAVTICIGYGDFLNETAKWNVSHFDDWIIVTEETDLTTREICRKFNLRCLLSHDGKKHGSPFNKGRLIERALHHTSEDSYRLHLDADIALPNGARHLLETAELSKDMVYGADRIDVASYKDWQRLQASGFMNHSLDYHCRVNIPEGFQIGTRWAHPQFGYVPIGFFQLFHASQDEWRGVRVKNYAMRHNSAARTDVQFAMQWDRSKRGLVPELIVAHLMSEKSPKGTNWNGRKSKWFGPDLSNSEKRQNPS